MKEGAPWPAREQWKVQARRLRRIDRGRRWAARCYRLARWCLRHELAEKPPLGKMRSLVWESPSGMMIANAAPTIEPTDAPRVRLNVAEGRASATAVLSLREAEALEVNLRRWRTAAERGEAWAIGN